MNPLSRRLPTISLSVALGAPLALLAAENAAPAQPPVPDQMQARMQAMQQTEGDARMPMMAAQMNDMQAMMKDFGAGCPMAGGQDHIGV